MKNGVKIFLTRLPDEQLRPRKSIHIITLDETTEKLINFLLNDSIGKTGVDISWFDGKYGVDCINCLYKIMEHMFSSENEIFYNYMVKEPGWERFDEVKTSVIRMFQLTSDSPFCKIKVESI